jgi:hypothetical protein
VRSTMQEIFGQHFADYAKSRTLHPRELRAAHAIMSCHTPALGGQVLSCPEGHSSVTRFHSCHHRSCPACADRPRQEWVEQELQRLLPCAHFHVVFTLPHDFLDLWSFNRKRMASLLFDCARESLLSLCADRRHLGATPGLLMALHTWGRTLSKHPHVHCLVSAGDVDPEGQWRASRSNYLVPAKALAALFRGKVLHHLSRDLQDGRLALPPQQVLADWLPCIRKQYRQHWNVQLSESYAHGRGVTLYLARYAKGGPLPASRPLEQDGQAVSFGYTDHRDRRAKAVRLSTDEFIGRVLWHAPPSRQHMIRHAGLYASSAKAHHRRCSRQLQPQTMPSTPSTLGAVPFAAAPTCPRCQQAMAPVQSLPPAHRFGEFSLAASNSGVVPTGSTGQWSGQSPAIDFGAPSRPFLRRRLPLT